jgi:hypothetical protein
VEPIVPAPTDGPRTTPLVVGCLLFLTYFLAVSLGQPDEASVSDWTLVVLSALPIAVTVQGLVGIVSVRRLEGQRSHTGRCAVDPRLIVVVPSIGRRDTLPALSRTVRSLQAILPNHFRTYEIDVVIDEGCETAEEVRRLAVHARTRIVEVPLEFETPRRTPSKARALEYASQVRTSSDRVSSRTWILHLDDDTEASDDALACIAEVCGRPPGSGGPLLAQGVLTYPRELAPNTLTWLADSIRPACDVSIFAFSTGSGSPLIGLHGELLLVHSQVEEAIGWDFGPRTLVEDAEFALHFAVLHPGRSAWFRGRSFGSSPASTADFIRQRSRWFAGLLELAFKPGVPLWARSRMIHNVAAWSLTSIANPVTNLVYGLTVGLNFGNSVAEILLISLCTVNFGFTVWLYWEGVRVNADASAVPLRARDRLLLLVCAPVFALWEAAGIAFGVARFLRRDFRFVVIAKPR